MILPTHTIGLVDIVSGSFGAGHDAAAHAIAEQLEGRGFATRIWDIVDLMPGPFGRALRAGYLRQIRSLPGSWRWLLHRLERDERLAGLIARAMNSASEPLLDIPVATYLTDMSVHSLWIHPSVDLHLGVHDLPSDEARQLGAGITRTIRPAVPAAFSDIPTSAAAKADARSALGLPRDGRLALVTGGSCGIGRLAESAADIAATGQAVPVVLCGRNDRLLRRIRRSPSSIGLGWTDNMPRVLTAVDAVVQNSGGFTSMETLAAGLPILTYRCIAGHGETNAAALDRAGLASWVKDADDLAPTLHRALSFGSPRERLDAAQPNLTVVDAIFADSRLRSA